MRRYLYYFLCICFKILPLKRRVTLFQSFGGLYNDNPKYISEKLHEIYPEQKIVWLISERANDKDIPSYIIRVYPYSVKYAYYQNVARVIIDNYVGQYYVLGGWKKAIQIWLLDKPFQKNYSTWHGTPLKKVGKDSCSIKNVNFYSTTDGFIFNSVYEKNLFAGAFSEKVPCFLLGSARNDLLFVKDENRQRKIKEKLGLPCDKKIVIYAPTFRGNQNTSTEFTSIYLDMESIKRILDALQRRFGNEWIFVSRVHQKVTEATQMQYNDIVINGNIHDDMAEYLFCSDVLITDYSGSLFDYTITKKPCFLYAPDIDNYINVERGIYMNMDQLPYSLAQDVDGMIDNIAKYDADLQSDAVDAFNKKIGFVDDGNACDRIAMMIKEVR